MVDAMSSAHARPVASAASPGRRRRRWGNPWAALAFAAVLCQGARGLGIGPEDCTSICVYQESTASCAARVHWAKEHMYQNDQDSCFKAHRLVMSQCTPCVSCSLEMLGCASPLANSPSLEISEGDFPEAILLKDIKQEQPTDAPMEEPMEQTTAAIEATTATPSTTEPPSTSTRPVTTVTTLAVGAVQHQLDRPPRRGSEQCDKVCTYKNEIATCQNRVLWGAQREFLGQSDACELAHGLVLEQCPGACALCLLQDTGCSKETHADSALPFECSIDLDLWSEEWSSAKKAWCCLHRRLACTTSTTDEQHDCSHEGGASSWATEKLAWCCHHKQMGCQGEEAYDCTMATAWQSWSEAHKRWCFEHSRFSTLHQCNVTDRTWNAGWPEDKQAWCCHYDQRWSQYKREWCCQRQGIACDEVYHDFAVKYQGLHQFGSLVAQYPITSTLACGLLGGAVALASYRTIFGDRPAGGGDAAGCYMGAPLDVMDVDVGPRTLAIMREEECFSASDFPNRWRP
mmetsp:Transcript_63659/g.207746  ORF Transcript_63659/g.207746 Transcript_63659/m.207746 type:complete len:515 (-) Transcript_63659:55-1599(-)